MKLDLLQTVMMLFDEVTCQSSLDGLADGLVQSDGLVKD
jgi:hypothetical protein